MRALFVVLALIGVGGQSPRDAPPLDESRVSNRIVGGVDAQRGQFPWIVHWEARGFMCGGTLIHPNAFITAGHCVRFDVNTGNLLRAGDVVTWNLINRITPEAEVKTGTVVSCTRHPSYAANTRNNDISLCVMQVSPTISPTPLAKLPVNAAALEFPPSYLTIAGWGKVIDSEDVDVSDILQIATIPVITTAVCNDANHYGALNLVVQPTQLCAGYDPGGVDACQGDSGGPLFYRAPTTGIITVVGITSFGEGCGMAKRPGIYTRVSQYMDWIKQTYPPICDVMSCTAPTPPSLPPSAPSSPPSASPPSTAGKGSCFDSAGKPLCGQAGLGSSGKACFCDMYCGAVADCCDDIYTACPSLATPTPQTNPTPKPSPLPSPPPSAAPPPSSPTVLSPTIPGSRVSTCKPAGSTSPSCGIQGQTSSPPACYCDSLCYKAGDCCSDFASVCPSLVTPTASSPSSLPPSPVSSPTTKPPSNMPPSSSAQTSCRNAEGNLLCGQKGYGNCYCDNVCKTNGDCCSDFIQLCPALNGGGNPPSPPTKNPSGGTSPTPKIVSGSCIGIGGLNYCNQKSQGLCWCDASCSNSGDCCADYGAVCQKSPSVSPPSPPSPISGTCIGPDGVAICQGKSAGACWCDSVCVNAGDCCPNRAAVCGSPG